MHTQVVDTANNSAPFTVTIHIMLVNDHTPSLLLDGTNQSYFTVFYEGQDYLGGEVPVRLSANLSIVDGDVGPQYLSRAEIQLVGSKRVCIYVCIYVAVCLDSINVSVSMYLCSYLSLYLSVSLSLCLSVSLSLCLSISLYVRRTLSNSALPLSPQTSLNLMKYS